MVAPAYNSSTWKEGKEDQEFKVQLSYSNSYHLVSKEGMDRLHSLLAAAEDQPLPCSSSRMLCSFSSSGGMEFLLWVECWSLGLQGSALANSGIQTLEANRMLLNLWRDVLKRTLRYPLMAPLFSQSLFKPARPTGLSLPLIASCMRLAIYHSPSSTGVKPPGFSASTGIT